MEIVWVIWAGNAYKKINLVVCTVATWWNTDATSAPTLHQTRLHWNNIRTGRLHATAASLHAVRAVAKLWKVLKFGAIMRKVAPVLKQPGRSCKLSWLIKRRQTNMALVSHATTSAVTKLVRNIQSNPERVLDVSQLELHHAVGKESSGRVSRSGTQPLWLVSDEPFGGCWMAVVREGDFAVRGDVVEMCGGVCSSACNKLCLESPAAVW